MSLGDVQTQCEVLVVGGDLVFVFPLPNNQVLSKNLETTVFVVLLLILSDIYNVELKVNNKCFTADIFRYWVRDKGIQYYFDS